jgi:GxxExxY protein
MNELLHGDITEQIIRAFHQVHYELGPGFLESVYASGMGFALTDAGLRVEREIPLTVYFRGRSVGVFRADMIVESVVLLEFKAGDRLDPTCEAQLINYLRATRLEVGLVLFFGSRPVCRRRILTNDRKFLPSSVVRESP